MNIAKTYGNVCSFCRHPVGTGKGKRTAARFTNVLMKLDPPKAPQLRGLVVQAEIILCLQCLETNTNNLIRAHTMIQLPAKMY